MPHSRRPCRRRRRTHTKRRNRSHSHTNHHYPHEQGEIARIQASSPSPLPHSSFPRRRPDNLIPLSSRCRCRRRISRPQNQCATNNSNSRDNLRTHHITSIAGTRVIRSRRQIRKMRLTSLHPLLERRSPRRRSRHARHHASTPTSTRTHDTTNVPRICVLSVPAARSLPMTDVIAPPSVMPPHPTAPRARPTPIDAHDHQIQSTLRSRHLHHRRTSRSLATTALEAGLSISLA